jgi:hypothetical protein
MKTKQTQLKQKIEHKFWQDGIDKTLPGYNEDEFIARFLDFVIELND